MSLVIHRGPLEGPAGGPFGGPLGGVPSVYVKFHCLCILKFLSNFLSIPLSTKGC